MIQIDSDSDHDMTPVLYLYQDIHADGENQINNTHTIPTASIVESSRDLDKYHRLYCTNLALMMCMLFRKQLLDRRERGAERKPHRKRASEISTY